MKVFIFLFFIFWCAFLKAQNLKDVLVLGGPGMQRTFQTYVSKTGQKYAFVGYSKSFSVDSSGSQITIDKSPFSTDANTDEVIALIKFDENWKYLSHVKMTAIVSELLFTSKGELILAFKAPLNHTVEFSDTKGKQTALIPQYNSNSANLVNGYAISLIKLSNSCEVLWTNIISRETIPDFANNLSFPLGTRGVTNFVINEKDEVKCYYAIKRPYYYNGRHDTVNIVNSNSGSTTVTASSQDLFLTFSSDGDFLFKSEPLRGVINHVSYDSANTSAGFCSMISDGRNTYATLLISTIKPDTFKISPNIFVNRGFHTIMIKLDTSDNLVFTKYLLRQVVSPGRIAKLHFDEAQNEILLSHFLAVLGTKDTAELFISAPIQVISGSSILCKLDSSGSVKWWKQYQNTYISQTVSSGTNGNTYFLANNVSFNSDPQLSGLFKVDYTQGLLSFIGILDKNANPIKVVEIIKNSSELSSGIEVFNHNFGVANPLSIAKNGYVYFSGNFKERIKMLCSDALAYNDLNLDGFVIGLDAEVYRKVSACDPILSPDKNEVWEVSGVYFDTIPNNSKCGDSIVVSDVQINRSFASISIKTCDSFFVSPSGKYNWILSGTYHDTLTNTVGCDSILTVQLVVTKIDVSVTQNTKFLAANQHQASYRWLDCDNNFNPLPGEVVQSFVATKSGNYAVELTVQSCKDTSRCYSVDLTGIKSTGSISNQGVHPNPTSGTVKFSEDFSGEVQIFAVDGRAVIAAEVTGSSGLDLSNLNPGVYIFVITTIEGRSFRAKVVKQ